MKAVAALLVLVGYVVMLIGIVRWSRRRITQRAEAARDALARHGAKILSFTPNLGWGTPAKVEFELQGKRAEFHVRSYGRDWLLASIVIPSPPFPGVMVRAERDSDRVGKALGLNREVQIGDADFDGAAYIVSNASDDTVQRLLASAAVREKILKILSLGYRVDMSPLGLRATRVQWKLDRFDPEPVADVMLAIEELLPLLPVIDLASAPGLPAPRFPRFAAAAIVFSGIFVPIFFVLVRLMPTPMNDNDSLKAIGIGMLVWVVVAVVIARVQRAHSLGLATFAVTILPLFFSVPLLSAAALFFVNAGLDASAPTTHRAKVTAVRGTRDDKYVHVVPWDADRSFQKVDPPFAVWKTLHVGDEIDVDVHPGALGWPWMSNVKKVE